MNINNYIIAEINIREYDINEDITIINSFEEVKRTNYWEDEEYDYKYENEKELKQKCSIKKNNKIISFTYYTKFNEKGKYKIEYSFTGFLTKIDYMFYGCCNLIYINLSNFNTQNVMCMKMLFCDCNSLKEINLSNFNTQNVTDMSDMFLGCNSLTNINLSNFNAQNVTTMSRMFYGCNSLKE